MPNFTLCLLLLVLCIFFSISDGTETSSVHSNSHSVVDKLCRKTTYPALCMQYISIFPKSVTQSPKKIAKAGLLVSLYRVQLTISHMKKVSTKLKAIKDMSRASKVKDHQVIEDCLELLGDEVGGLSQSIMELTHLFGVAGKGEKADYGCDYACHVNNIQSYLSGALSDASTCVDEFVKRRHPGKLISAMKTRARNAEQVTANALDLFCQIAKCA